VARQRLLIGLAARHHFFQKIFQNRQRSLETHRAADQAVDTLDPLYGFIQWREFYVHGASLKKPERQTAALVPIAERPWQKLPVQTGRAG
jgi:hypothetical protein